MKVGLMETREDILDKLAMCKCALADKYGIEQLGLFGSTARGEQEDGSDIDVVVRLARPNLLARIGLRQELEAVFNRKVDVVSLHEHLPGDFRKNVEHDAIYV